MIVIHTQRYRTNHPTFNFLWTSLYHVFYSVLYRTVCYEIDQMSAGEVIKVHHSLRLHLHRIACRNLHRLLAECYRLSHLSCHNLSALKSRMSPTLVEHNINFSEISQSPSYSTSVVICPYALNVIDLSDCATIIFLPYSIVAISTCLLQT